MKIALGSDHAGWEMKKDLKLFLEEQGCEVKDVGTDGPDSVDYPDYTMAVAEVITNGEAEKGIMICGTGLGSAITANKIPGIRSTVCHNAYTAEMSRAHNDANLLCLGERVIDKETAREVVKVWIDTPFSNDPRHIRRLDKIKKLEENSG